MSPRVNPCAVPAQGMWHHGGFWRSLCFSACQTRRDSGQSLLCPVLSLTAWFPAAPFPWLLTALSPAFSQILERELGSRPVLPLAVPLSTGCCWVNSAALETGLAWVTGTGWGQVPSAASGSW